MLLGGCHLLDRGDIPAAFGGARPERMPKPPPPRPAPPGPPPLVTIHFAPGVDWRPALARAVREARARKPNVVFQVTSILPNDAAAAHPDTTDAQLVAQAIIAQGVPPAFVQLQARVDPSVHEREVRVYLR